MIFCSTYPYTLVKLHTCVTIKFLNKSWYMIYCAYKIDQDPPKIQPSLKHLQKKITPNLFFFVSYAWVTSQAWEATQAEERRKKERKNAVSGGHLVP